MPTGLLGTSLRGDRCQRRKTESIGCEERRKRRALRTGKPGYSRGSSIEEKEGEGKDEIMDNHKKHDHPGVDR